MYSITTYVRGPELQHTTLQSLFGRPGNNLYYLNPQLYKESASIPLYNFGVFTMKTNQGEISSDEILEARVNEAVKSYLGATVRIGALWLETEHIQFSVERDSE